MSDLLLPPGWRNNCNDDILDLCSCSKGFIGRSISFISTYLFENLSFFTNFMLKCTFSKTCLHRRWNRVVDTMLQFCTVWINIHCMFNWDAAEIQWFARWSADSIISAQCAKLYVSRLFFILRLNWTTKKFSFKLLLCYRQTNSGEKTQRKCKVCHLEKKRVTL